MPAKARSKAHESRTVADDLREAIALTKNAVSSSRVEDATVAVALRAPALERAAEHKRTGKSWGPEEDHLASELMALDLQLIQILWAQNADAFAWLRDRDASKVAGMPHLRQLSEL